MQKNKAILTHIIYNSITLVALCALNACSFITKPSPFGLYRGMEDGAPEGSEEFRSGWKAGCNSGIAVNGTLHYKATHDFEYDEAQLQNDEYHAAWRLVFRHCRWYTAEWTR